MLCPYNFNVHLTRFALIQIQFLCHLYTVLDAPAPLFRVRTAHLTAMSSVSSYFLRPGLSIMRNWVELPYVYLGQLTESNFDTSVETPLPNYSKLR